MVQWKCSRRIKLEENNGRWKGKILPFVLLLYIIFFFVNIVFRDERRSNI